VDHDPGLYGPPDGRPTAEEARAQLRQAERRVRVPRRDAWLSAAVLAILGLVYASFQLFGWSSPLFLAVCMAPSVLFTLRSAIVSTTPRFAGRVELVALSGTFIVWIVGAWFVDESDPATSRVPIALAIAAPCLLGAAVTVWRARRS
jgi:hypothetical protein